MVFIPLPDALGIPSPDWFFGSLYIVFAALFEACTGGALGAAGLIVVHRAARPHDALLATVNERLSRMMLPLIIGSLALSVVVRILDVALWGNFSLVACARGGFPHIAAAVAMLAALAAATQLSYRPRTGGASREIALPLLVLVTLTGAVAIMIGNEALMHHPWQWHAAGLAPPLAGALAGSIAIAAVAMAGTAADDDERLIRYGMRLLAGGTAAWLCILPWWIYAVAPDIQSALLAYDGPLFFAVGITVLLSLSLLGTALLGILRPRNAIWRHAAAIELIACIAAQRFLSYTMRAASARDVFSTADISIHAEPLMTILLVVWLAAAAAAIWGISPGAKFPQWHNDGQGDGTSSINSDG